MGDGAAEMFAHKKCMEDVFARAWRTPTGSLSETLKYVYAFFKLADRVVELSEDTAYAEPVDASLMEVIGSLMKRHEGRFIYSGCAVSLVSLKTESIQEAIKDCSDSDYLGLEGMQDPVLVNFAANTNYLSPIVIEENGKKRSFNTVPMGCVVVERKNLERLFRLVLAPPQKADHYLREAEEIVYHYFKPGDDRTLMIRRIQSREIEEMSIPYERL